MCAVARWNVAVQEDKALFGHISRRVPWKHVVEAVSFVSLTEDNRMAGPINQANDGHQGKVPTHCQVSLWLRDKLIKSGVGAICCSTVFCVPFFKALVPPCFRVSVSA